LPAKEVVVRRSYFPLNFLTMPVALGQFIVHWKTKDHSSYRACEGNP